MDTGAKVQSPDYSKRWPGCVGKTAGAADTQTTSAIALAVVSVQRKTPPGTVQPENR